MSSLALLNARELKLVILFSLVQIRHTIVNESLGALRLKVGQDRGLVEAEWRILWVVDFPMFEKGQGRLSACHHPFTSPKTDSVS